MSTPAALPINPYVIAVSVYPTPTGFAGAAVNNLALFSKDVPVNGAITQANPGVYVDSASVAGDWGTGSETYALAQMVFNQLPNMIEANGVLIIYPMGSTQTLQAALLDLWSRQFIGGYIYGGYTPSSYEVISAAQAAQSLGNLGVFGFNGFYQPTDALYGSGAVTSVTNTAGVITSVSVSSGGSNYSAFDTSVTIIDPLGTGVGAAATATVVGGVITGITVSTHGSGYSAGSYARIDSTPAAYFVNNGLTNARAIYYGANGTALGARLAAAAFAAKYLSVDFSVPGSATAYQLKQLSGLAGDPTASLPSFIGQATDGPLSGTLQGIGADSYPNFGLTSGSGSTQAGIFTTGANGGFFDTLYGLKSMSYDIQVAGYNAIAQVGTKIAQTESGVDQLIAVFQGVLQQYVEANFIAPGTWNPPYPGFGSNASLVANIANQGFYIYALPLSKQSQVNRSLRKSPPISIAAKLAGAIDSAQVSVFFQP